MSYALITTLILSSLTNTGGVRSGMDSIRLSQPQRFEGIPTAEAGREMEKDSERRIVTATAYTSRIEEADDSPCIAASNKDICKLHAQGIRSAASNDIPLYTKIYAAGEEWIILDRMNRRFTGKNHIDLYFGDDLQAAREWGVREIEIIIEK